MVSGVKILSATLWVGICTALAAAPLSESEYSSLRTAARHRQRQVIFDNDGCDILYFPKKLEPTVENFLSLRTAYLAGKVDTLVYCPISAGLGNYTVKLPHGHLLTNDPPRPDARNISSIWAEQEIDLFKVLRKFTADNNMELFWSFRFNDVHDWRHTPEKPYFLFGKWKDQHRHLLFGRDITKNPPFGWWSYADYTHKEVRDYMLVLVDDVLKQYPDLNGINFDFSRYLPIFRRTAFGETATAEEVEMFNDFMRAVRKKMDQHGMEHGRGMLLGVVLPDDPAFTKALGYDMQTWLTEGLIDIWQLPDSYHLNPYSQTAALAKKYEVCFYPHAGSPYPHEARENKPQLNRRRLDAYRARAWTVKQSGANGVYIYNVSTEVGLKEVIRPDLEAWRDSDKRYFLTDIAWECPVYEAAYEAGSGTLPQLTGTMPMWFSPGYPRQLLLEIGDDLPNSQTTLSAIADRSKGTGNALKISSRGKEWTNLLAIDRHDFLSVPDEALIQGVNTILFDVAKVAEDTPAYELFSGKTAKDFDRPLYGDNGIEETPDGLKLSGPLAAVAKRFGVESFAVLTGEASVMITDKDHTAGLRVADLRGAELLKITLEGISLEGEAFFMPLDMSRFQHLTLTLSEKNVLVTANGQTVYQCPRKRRLHRLNADAECRMPSNVSSVAAGSFSGLGGGTGASVWKQVRATLPAGSIQLINFAVDVKYDINHPQTPELPNVVWKEVPAPGAECPHLLAAEAKLRLPETPLLLAFSNGQQAAVWYLSRDGVKRDTDRIITFAPDDGSEVHSYRIGFLPETNDLGLYKNEKLLLPLSKIPTPEILINRNRKLFSSAEKEILKNGGLFLRPLLSAESVFADGQLRIAVMKNDATAVPE